MPRNYPCVYIAVGNKCAPFAATETPGSGRDGKGVDCPGSGVRLTSVSCRRLVGRLSWQRGDTGVCFPTEWIGPCQQPLGRPPLAQSSGAGCGRRARLDLTCRSRERNLLA